MKVRPVQTLPGDILLVPGDIHFDCEDPDALTLMLKVANYFGVNTVALVGDTFESAGISRHGRPARKFRFGRSTIQAEGNAASPWISELRTLVSTYRHRKGGLHVLTGNHEQWWAGLQDDYPGLLDTPWYELYGDLFNHWHVHAENTSLKFGPLLVAHGHRLRGALSRYTAATVLSNYPGQNTLYGHTHRVDSCITPYLHYGDHVLNGAWTIGHLRDVQRELADPFLGPHAERHQQGFALVFFFNVDGELRFKVDQAVIHRGPDGEPYTIMGGLLFEL